MLPRALCTAVAVLVVIGAALPVSAQISSQTVRERYDRIRKGESTAPFKGIRDFDSDDPEKRFKALKDMAESKEDPAIEYLLQAVGDQDLRIKAKALDVLGEIRAAEATPVLVQQLFLRDVNDRVKQRILACLGEIGDARATRPITEFLQRDVDRDIRGTAIFALGEIGAPESMTFLREMAHGAGDPTLQRLASEAIAKVQYQEALVEIEADEPTLTFLQTEQQ